LQGGISKEFFAGSKAKMTYFAGIKNYLPFIIWDKEKIESLFSSNVVNHILDIPLFDIVEEDKLVWNDNMHGQYSVKSGYNVLLESIGKGVKPTSQWQWNNIWKIQAPSKAKHLLWRICKGCIPTQSRLQDRCVQCPLINLSNL
jgi:hypothetical protein